MKDTEWILLVVVAIISAGLAVWLSDLILGNPDEASYTIKIAPSITSVLEEPDVEIFNVNAINPIEDVYIDSGDCDTDGDGVVSPSEARACNALND